MRIVIIEDEPLTAKDLARTIRSVEPSVEILPILCSVENAVDFLSQSPKIDLIFSDIQLGDGLSFDIFKQVSIAVPVIFCTAFEEYSLAAFQAHSIDYVLKPFNEQKIKKTIEKYQSLKAQFSSTPSNLANLLNQLQRNHTTNKSAIIVRQAEKIIPLQSDDIALFFVDNQKTHVYTFAQKQYPIQEKMETLTAKFPTFFRTSRQILLNRIAVKEAAHYFNRTLIVRLTIPFSEEIVVGKRKTTAFIDWLETGK
ncbi:MAG: LytTR family DNA-binding domain-containing protein [Bacteroidota bacterium]